MERSVRQGVGLPGLDSVIAGARDPGLAMADKPPRTVYYRKQIPLFRLVQKIKLWPSRQGILHGVRSFEARGDYGEILTHCNRRMVVRNSKRSRSARWLRNKWSVRTCETCKIPEWKLQKYSATFFRRRYGSQLLDEEAHSETTR